jgi:hypothetical protein
MDHRLNKLKGGLQGVFEVQLSICLRRFILLMIMDIVGRFQDCL